MFLFVGLRPQFIILTLVLLGVAGCSPAAETTGSADSPSSSEYPPASDRATFEADLAVDRLPTPTPFATIIAPDDRGPLGPIRIPDFQPSFPFDAIYPIYDPVFVNAVDADLQPDELVIGIAWEGEAKAYPITVLRFREMVNDELAGPFW